MSAENDNDLDRRIAAQLALRESVAAYEHARADAALAVRDARIRDALAAGVRPVDVRAIVGVSATRLSQIRRGGHVDVIDGTP
jgi:hypothetical protein